MFSCATPNQLYLITSVFGVFYSPHRFLSGYLEGSLTTGSWAVAVVWVEIAGWGTPHTSCPNGGSLLLKQLLHFQDWQVFSPFLGWEREENNLNPGNAQLHMTIYFQDRTPNYLQWHCLYSHQFYVGSYPRFTQFQVSNQIWLKSKICHSMEIWGGFSDLISVQIKSKWDIFRNSSELEVPQTIQLLSDYHS